MNYDIQVDSETGWGRVTITGDIYFQNFLGVLKAAWADPNYATVTHAIWDFSEGHSTFDFDKVVDLTKYISREKKGRGPSVVAVVAAKDLEFGLSRIFATFEEQYGYKVQVFRRMEEAEHWLSG